MEELINKAKKGDSEAFVKATNMCIEMLYKLGKRFALNDEDIGDAIQDTILTAFEKLNSLKQSEYFKTWLVRIFINKCNAIMKNKLKVISLDEVKECSDCGNKDLENVELNEAINKLTKDYRAVIILFYIMGFSIKEICFILEEKEGTIKSRLSRARNELRKLYLIKREA